MPINVQNRNKSDAVSFNKSLRFTCVICLGSALFYSPFYSAHQNHSNDHTFVVNTFAVCSLILSIPIAGASNRVKYFYEFTILDKFLASHFKFKYLY